MNILHFIPSIDLAGGGPAESLQQLCKIYRSAGHNVEVASLDDPQRAATLHFPVPVHALGPSSGTYGYSKHALPWLKRNLGQYDLLVINAIWQYNGLAGYRAAIATNTPYAVFVHGMLDPYFKRQYPLKHLKKLVYWVLYLRRILHRAGAVLFTCEQEKILARESFPGHQVREEVVPYGIYRTQTDLEQARDAFYAKWPELRDKRLALFLGRIHVKKGIDLLIQAYAATMAHDPQWRLVIAGPDQTGLQAELQALAERLGIADRVVWTGMLKDDLKWGSIRAAELFALSSHQENFGISVAEALACGTPVAISDQVNIWREIVGHEAGLVAPDTVEGTTDMLRRWTELTDEQRAAMRNRTVNCFQECFDYERSSQVLLSILEKVIENHKHKA